MIRQPIKQWRIWLFTACSCGFTGTNCLKPLEIDSQLMRDHLGGYFCSHGEILRYSQPSLFLGELSHTWSAGSCPSWKHCWLSDFLRCNKLELSSWITEKKKEISSFYSLICNVNIKSIASGPAQLGREGREIIFLSPFWNVDVKSIACVPTAKALSTIPFVIQKSNALHLSLPSLEWREELSFATSWCRYFA